MTQGELARLANLSTSQISNIERGEFAPSLEALEKITRALRMKLPHLFQFDLADRDQARTEQLVKLMTLGENLRPADLEFAIEMVRLVARRSKKT
jgi:transcriptional regulator with XRE-family HTH domain